MEIFEMLINRNITVNGHRTSIRLEPEFWSGLADIAQCEHLTIDELCCEVDSSAGDLSRTAAIRVFIASYQLQRAQQPVDQQPRAPFTTVEGNYADPQRGDEFPAASQRFRATG
ncbi:MAG: putative DNA-binding ribbon-helix-helix protein [Alphaproteobacteria bacterium]|jgi:predicted DNA-binding ribbon-helix-helix protein